MKPIHVLPLFAFLPTIAHAQPNGAELLRAMERAEKSARYSGVATLARAGQPTMTMRVVRDGTKRRVEWLSPPVMRGDVLVDDGKTLLRYEKSENAAFQIRSNARQAQNSVRTPNARVTGSAKIANRDAFVVAIKSPSGATRRIFIDKATRARLRAETLNVSGQRVETLSLQRVQFGPQPASAFAFRLPAGVQLTKTNGALYSRLAPARRAASWLRAPSYVPRGYAFESAIVDPKGDAWLRYSNGARRFSVFQQRAKVQNAAPQKVDGGWLARKNGSRFAIIDAPGNEGRRIADSLR